VKLESYGDELISIAEQLRTSSCRDGPTPARSPLARGPAEIVLAREYRVVAVARQPTSTPSAHWHVPLRLDNHGARASCPVASARLIFRDHIKNRRYARLQALAAAQRDGTYKSSVALAQGGRSVIETTSRVGAFPWRFHEVGRQFNNRALLMSLSTTSVSASRVLYIRPLGRQQQSVD